MPSNDELRRLEALRLATGGAAAGGFAPNFPSVMERAEAYYTFLSGIKRSTTPIAPAKPKAAKARNK